MSYRRTVSLVFVVLVCTLLAGPALAATVKCPSTCSCLLPADAKKQGFTGYCGGNQAVCGYDTAKNEMYCYEKTVTTLPGLFTTLKPIVTTTKPTVVTTTVSTTTAAPQCPSGCLCARADDAKAKGLSSCGGTQTVCGYDQNQVPMYCYVDAVQTATSATTTAATTTSTVASDTTETTAAPAPCPSTCSCLVPDKADAAGSTACDGAAGTCAYDPAGRPMSCYADRNASVHPALTETTLLPSPTATTTTNAGIPIILEVTTPATAPAPEQNIVAAIFAFFATLFGGGEPEEGPRAGSGVSNPTVEQPSSVAAIDACRARLGLDSCRGACVNFSTDETACGSCGTTCYDDEICCGGSCVRNTSTEHCGECGRTCPAGQVCQNGRCDAWGCYYGNIECSGVCVDTRTDPENCGSCGTRCPADSRCVDGVCTLCPLNRLSCDGRCVASATDRENCGACRNSCPDDAVCSNGSCFACSGWNPDRCGNDCVNLLADSNHCGACGNACPNGTYCSAGRCACPGYERGVQMCPSGVSGRVVCVDTLNDRNNCGGCGGMTTHRCAANEVCCNGECIDLANDPDSCGRCGNACPADLDRGAGICRAGTCTYCDAGYYGCEAESGAVSCIDRWTSPSNCGACGRACDEGESCCAGQCADLDTSDLHCGTCSTTCLTSEDCCDGTCTDVWYNEDHCGSCGNHCIRPDRDHCIMGKCCNAAGTNCE